MQALHVREEVIHSQGPTEVVSLECPTNDLQSEVMHLIVTALPMGHMKYGMII